jgi:hypothetical protein
MKKGQFALEFVILISFTLLFSAVILVVIQKSYIDAQRMQHEEQIEQIVRIISAEVNMAELSPPGYMRNFTIPRLINGWEYQLNSSDDVDIVFHYNGRDYVYFFPNATLKGACSCLRTGINIIKKECPGNNVCIIKLMNPSTMNSCIYYDGIKCQGNS